jgi:hypothetical protein
MSKWQEYKDKNGTTPLDLLNPKTKPASDIVSMERYNLCSSCPELIKLTKQCKQCGCFMPLKTKLDGSKCPIGKW